MTTKIKKYFVIGNPIDHSFSPKLHNYWLKENNINALYDKIKLDEKNKELSKDESFQNSEDLQGLTNKFIEKIETLFAEKEKDILKV